MYPCWPPSCLLAVGVTGVLEDVDLVGRHGDLGPEWGRQSDRAVIRLGGFRSLRGFLLRSHQLLRSGVVLELHERRGVVDEEAVLGLGADRDEVVLPQGD